MHNILIIRCPLRTDDNISHVAAVEAACRLTIKNLRETKPDLLSKVDVDKILPPISNTNEEENKEEPSNSMTNQVIASILDEKVERINSLQDMSMLYLKNETECNMVLC